MGFSNQVGGALGAGMAGAILAGIGNVGLGYLFLGATVACALLTPLFGKQLGETVGRTLRVGQAGCGRCLDN